MTALQWYSQRTIFRLSCLSTITVTLILSFEYDYEAYLLGNATVSPQDGKVVWMGFVEQNPFVFKEIVRLVKETEDTGYRSVWIGTVAAAMSTDLGYHIDMSGGD